MILSPEDIAAAERLRGDTIRSKVKTIVVEVASIAEVSADAIMGRDRTASVAAARAIVLVAAQRAGISAPQLARVMRRDVSTIKHILATEKARRESEGSPE